TALVFLNQIREKVGVMYGNPEVTPGGRALKFYSSVRIEVRRKENIRQGGEIVGHDMRVKITKNKLYPPYKEAVVRIIYGKGIDIIHALMEAAISTGVIQRNGSYYSFNGERLAQGKESLRKVLVADKTLQDKIREAVLATVANGTNGDKE
ncbi:MAG TPA: DNA recombination/repair protein RecA, partial [Thermotoga sp.]|nr:DNA recombination/repair protein RecA [Thermotoga sp.]